MRHPLIALFVLLAGCNSDALPSVALDGAPLGDFAPGFVVDDLSVPADTALPNPCADGILDGDETDVDCGGTVCGACGDGLQCLSASDCVHNRCLLGVCRSTNDCKDGMRDNKETDVDCGGPACAYCQVGQHCRGDADCLGVICTQGLCANPTPLALMFAAPVSYPAGMSSRDVAAADFTGDGRLDLVVQNNGTDDVTFFRGHGDGTFYPGISYAVGHFALAVATGDFNGDYKVDIAVTGSNTAGVAVILGNGDGSFSPETRTLVGGNISIWGIAAGDLNGDGLDDLVIGNHYQALPVFISTGDGKFQLDTTADSSSGPDGIQIGDFDRDGHADVVGDDQNGIVFLKGNGKGKLGLFQKFTSMHGCPSGMAYDLDRDGALDVVTCYGDLYPGKGDGTFAAAKNYPLAPNGGKPAAADFDRDGIVDLAAADQDGVHLARGAKPGTFLPAQLFPCTSTSFRLAVGDFNGDGKPDIATVDMKGQLLVLMNVSK